MTLAPNDPRHGTPNGYVNLGCRCDACRTAQTGYLRERGYGSYRRDRCACGQLKQLLSLTCRDCANAAREPEHGTESRYTNRDCRCSDCRAAANAARRKRRKPVENPAQHGVYWVYTSGCRCDECREAWKLRQREIAAAKREAAA